MIFIDLIQSTAKKGFFSDIFARKRYKINAYLLNLPHETIATPIIITVSSAVILSSTEYTNVDSRLSGSSHRVDRRVGQHACVLYSAGPRRRDMDRNKKRRQPLQRLRGESLPAQQRPCLQQCCRPHLFVTTRRRHALCLRQQG